MKQFFKFILNTISTPLHIRLSYLARPILAFFLKGSRSTGPINGKSFKSFCLLASLLFFISTYSQVSSKQHKFKNPPGTVKLNDSLYIDVVPVDNQMHYEFQVSRINFWNEEVHETLKTLDNYGLNWDTIEKQLGYNNEKFIKKTTSENKMIIALDSVSFTILKYPNYPIINISKTEAVLYCKWRTDLVKLGWAINSKTEKKRSKYPKDILYRLPTTKEFNNAIATFGYSKKNHEPYYETTPIFPYRLKYKKKNRKAIFLKDNISEYTIETTPFGSNWKKESTFSTVNDYTGFRCVCEILE